MKERTYNGYTIEEIRAYEEGEDYSDELRIALIDFINGDSDGSDEHVDYEDY